MTKFSKVALVGLVTLVSSALVGVSLKADGFQDSLPLLFQAASSTAVVAKNALDIADQLQRKNDNDDAENR